VLKKKGSKNIDLSNAKEASAAPASPEHKKENRMSSFYLRTVTTIAMLVGFIVILFLGHGYAGLFVIALLILCFKELKALKRKREQEKRIPFFNIVNWYFFACTLIFIVPLYFPTQTKTGITNPWLLWLFQYHVFLSFCSFIAGILLFTLSLESELYKYQFKMLGWTLVILLVVVSQASSLLYNIYKGLYWFIFPALCVVANDIFAYIFGFFLGKTPLIKLSPKKTWEGFMGGFLCVLIWAGIGSYIMSGIPALVCPQTQITLEPFAFPDCIPSSIYSPKQYFFPFPVLGYESIWVAPVQLHSFVIAVFSSICAPFGGFFASGFKRAFKLKDFGTTIPGHGGLTDRFD